MRRTGKTTRIANYAIDQLLSCGNVVVADHSAFETNYPAHRQEHLINMVLEIWDKCYAKISPNIEVDVKMHALRDFDKFIRVIHFSLKHKEPITGSEPTL